MTDGTSSAVDAATIRKLIENWARVAVRAKDWDGILAHHFDDILMFDVPPLESRGITAYRETWNLFYSVQPEPVGSDIQTHGNRYWI